MDAHIRDALIPQELPLLRELFQEYATGLGIDLCFQGFAEELATLPGRYAEPPGGLYLATVDGVPAGCIALRPLEPPSCELKRLFVRPAFRAFGLGRALAQHALSAAAAKGYRRVCLDTLPTMARAIALYRSLGFGEIAAYCHNPVPDAIFLGRALD